MLEILDELLSISTELGIWAVKLLRSSASLVLQRAEASGEDGFADQSYRHAKIESINGRPFTSAFLSCRVKNLFKQWRSVSIIVIEDVFGDLDQERVEDALVPLGHYIPNFFVVHSQTSLHKVIRLSSRQRPRSLKEAVIAYLRDELHISVFDAVVYHLHVVSSTLITNPVTAWLSIALGCNALEDILDMRPSSFVASWHKRWSVSCAFLTPRNSCPNEEDPLLAKVLASAVAIRVVRVSAVNDDITFRQQW